MANCRFCNTQLGSVFADLGMSPLSNSYLVAEQLGDMEPFLPLKVWVCDECKLVQLEQYQAPEEIFRDYAYFSSYSDSWLKHASNYCTMIIDRLGLDSDSRVIEIASNDGYLLQYFKAAGIPALGIEPAANVAAAAQDKGIETIVEFFGRELAERLATEGKKADLLLGNNVLAHVPDLNDFVAGLSHALNPNGAVTMEFPHLLRLMAGNQFDTIYHEHFSYLSLTAVDRVFKQHGLRVYDVEQLPTHGGSLRIFACHDGRSDSKVGSSVRSLLAEERAAGFDKLETYLDFSKRAYRVKNDLLSFLISARREGKRVAAYGAPAKGNTLLNFCGIRTDYLDFTVDRSPVKQGKFLPGTHIPILAPEALARSQPDYILILPWNLRDEIISQLSHVRDWGGRFVVAIPELEIIA